MKATDLNGTHIGQSISITLGESSLTDVLTEISHEADLIQETPLFGKENWVPGRRHTRLQFQSLGSIRVNPEAVIILGGTR